jgi:hypothetical protein
MFGALVYALVGFRILLSSASSVVVDARQYAGQVDGSGGVGAVSVGVSDTFLLYAALVIGSIVASWMLAPWVSDSDRRIKTLHRIHRWTIGLPFVFVILVPITFFLRPGPLSQLWVPASGVAWGLQFVLTAALLAAFAVRR